MFIKKTATEILNNGLKLLSENTPIDNLHPGAISRTILESFAFEIGEGADEKSNLYKVSEHILNNGYLSLAEDKYLDLIGELLDYPRREEESYDGLNDLNLMVPISDEAYRMEISQRVHTIASSNEAAIKMALMALNGVKEVKGEEYTHGTGSFSYVVVPLAGYSNEAIKEAAEDAIAEVKAYGIRYEIRMPIEVPIDVQIQIVMKESAIQTDRITALDNTRLKLIAHFEKFDVNQPFIYNDLVQEVMNSDEKIMDFKVLSFYMGGEPVLLTNQAVADDERIRPGSIQIV